MGKDPSSFSTSEIGAEILMFITTSIMAIASIFLSVWELGNISLMNDPRMSLYLSSGFKLFLTLLSYHQFGSWETSAG
jgi:hypothetical protein